MSAMKSWLPIQRSSHFSLANIPFGIITTPTKSNPRPAVAIGEYVLDLQDFAAQDGFSEIEVELSVFSQPTLNAFAALGRPVHRKVRKYLQDVLSESGPYPKVLKENRGRQESCIIPQRDVTMHLPMKIGDYTDFYAGKNHAYTMGVILRGPDNALQPNYTHLPVGYHGRASSVVVSGTPVVRPNGQVLENPTATPKVPAFSPSKRLDIELELGAFVCKENKMGQNIPVSQAEESIFGLVLLNDWSARDIQAWEYVPLGPFQSKNFCSTISPWVVLVDALEPFRTKGLENKTELLPYLQEKNPENVFDIRLQIDLTPKGKDTETILNSNGKYLLFSFNQMLAHHSISGCPMKVGDLLGSGTISGTEQGTEGSIAEYTRGGKNPLKLKDGTERLFLQDGDNITMYGVCGSKETGLVGFGECSGTIQPAFKATF